MHKAERDSHTKNRACALSLRFIDDIPDPTPKFRSPGILAAHRKTCENQSQRVYKRKLAWE